MLNLPSRVLAIASGLAVVAALAYWIDIGERTGVVLLFAVALASLVALFAVLGTAVRDTAPYVPADAPPPDRQATTPGAAPAGSVWPLLAALALGVVAVGIPVGKALVYIGVILVGVTAIGWFGRSWLTHPTWSGRVRTRVTNRLVAPILTPLAAFVIAIGIAIGVSRVLLAVNEHASVLVALVVAVILITAFFLVAARPRLRSSALAGLAGIGVVALVGAGFAGASQGEREFEHKGTHPPELDVAAKNTAFDVQKLDAPSGKPVVITFKNEDPKAIYHNVAVYDDGSTPPKPLYNGQGIPGGRKIAYRHTFDKPGTYRFQCDFHTNMKGEFVVS